MLSASARTVSTRRVRGSNRAMARASGVSVPSRARAAVPMTPRSSASTDVPRLRASRSAIRAEPQDSGRSGGAPHVPTPAMPPRRPGRTATTARTTPYSVATTVDGPSAGAGSDADAATTRTRGGRPQRTAAAARSATGRAASSRTCTESSGAIIRRARDTATASANRSSTIASLTWARPVRSIQTRSPSDVFAEGHPSDAPGGSRPPSGPTRSVAPAWRSPAGTPDRTAAPRTIVSTPTPPATRASK